MSNLCIAKHEIISGLQLRLGLRQNHLPGSLSKANYLSVVEEPGRFHHYYTYMKHSIDMIFAAGSVHQP